MTTDICNQHHRYGCQCPGNNSHFIEFNLQEIYKSKKVRMVKIPGDISLGLFQFTGICRNKGTAGCIIFA